VTRLYVCCAGGLATAQYDRLQAAQLRYSSDPSASVLTTPPSVLTTPPAAAVLMCAVQEDWLPRSIKQEPIGYSDSFVVFLERPNSRRAGCCITLPPQTDAKGRSFQLKGVVVHQGESYLHGHFMAYIHTPTGWLVCDDSTVRRRRPEDAWQGSDGDLCPVMALYTKSDAPGEPAQVGKAAH
jgi:hypothetical protein